MSATPCRLILINTMKIDVTYWQGLERWLGCLYRSTTASGENAFLLTIYSLAIGCRSKLVKTGDSELAQGSLPFNKYYRSINAMFSGEDTSTDRIARS